MATVTDFVLLLLSLVKSIFGECPLFVLQCLFCDVLVCFLAHHIVAQVSRVCAAFIMSHAHVERHSLSSTSPSTSLSSSPSLRLSRYKVSSTSYEPNDHFISEAYVEYTQKSFTEQRFPDDFDCDDITIGHSLLNAYGRRAITLKEKACRPVFRRRQ